MQFKNFIDLNKKKPAGQAMVEFALILTVMMGLFVGTYELMVLFRKRTDLATATRMATRQASELWINSVDEAAFQDSIQNYVYEELEIMGYNRSWMEGNPADDSDDHVRVGITAAELDPTDKDEIVDTTGPAVCTYGQYIEVELEMDWTFAVLPFDQIFGGTNGESGVITETALVRCWRGS